MNDSRVDELKTLLPQCMLHDWVKLGARLVRCLKDKRHPAKHGEVLDRLLEQARQSIALRHARAENLPQVECPPELPISARRTEIVDTIRRHQVVVIAGETGSGKTTQIPKLCLEAGLGVEAKIGCTQPRRVAALSISQRIAEELGVKWGREVGCKIRFDDHSSDHTYIKLMTDGILLAETQGDPNLSEYNAIILDEAHERSLNIDFLLGYLKGLLRRRKDLKLVVTSATIDTQAFSQHFNDAPIIEVSGRVYPVDVEYRPMDEKAEDRGDISFVDAAVEAAEDVVHNSPAGDILIFMPGERDIRETSDLLEGRLAGGAEIIPMFGRLSAGDQQRVFAGSSRRKIVVATNIAETSLTIPGIRYVIDSGLARISRYSPRSRTRRLPVEPVSQSSANQRKGRAGRVEDGICIRLYSEENFDMRPPFTQPEIQRSNLAEVILRMKAFHLGEIETFEFIQPPAPHAIATGYSLLQELGALDRDRELTDLGRGLARLPIDPTLGRMLLQSQQEHATRELLIIAAGLSIQDPRERPLEKRAEADALHKRFNVPRSDFMALLNIWNAVHDQWESLRSQNQRRKFCRQNFLSYLRMREWQDLHAQLLRALAQLGTVKLNESSADYDAIHRSILAGLIGHAAHREERNIYKAAGSRKTFVFPGSVLHERTEKKKPGKKPEKQSPPPKTNQPKWIVAGEIVETSQVFARTVAGINPQWIFELAPHCCQRTHRNPHWSAKAGRVLAEEVVTLQGLELLRRKVGYGNVNPGEATEIFIRSALVEEELLPSHRGSDAVPEAEARFSKHGKVINAEAFGREGDTRRKLLPARYAFLEHNRAVREKVENWQTRVRRYDFANLDQTLFEFYARQITNVSSIHEFNRWLSEHGQGDSLRIGDRDLIGEQSIDFDDTAYPESVTIAGQPVPVTYAYAPGEENDGVTVRLPFSIAQTLSSGVLEWAVPGLREEKINELFRALPKSVRRELMPFAPKVGEIVGAFEPAGGSFFQELAGFIFKRYGVQVPLDAWTNEALPVHLRPRIELMADDQKPLGAGRDLDALRKQFEKVDVDPAQAPADWQRATASWERFGLTTWSFGDLPEKVVVSEGRGLPVYGWPGLEYAEGNVNVRLFRSRDEAVRESVAGVNRLIELAIHKDLGWLEKDLKALNKLAPLYTAFGDSQDLKGQALELARRHLFPKVGIHPLKEASFVHAVKTAEDRLRGLGQAIVDRLGMILKLRESIHAKLGGASGTGNRRQTTLNDLSQLGQLVAKPASGPIAEQLDRILPRDFLSRLSWEQLEHVPRYLKALQVRADRAGHNAARDRERVTQLQPYLDRLRTFESKDQLSAEATREISELRFMIREYEVSLFAQEIGTAVPVSPKRLDAQIETIMGLGG